MEAATGKTESLIIPREDSCGTCSGTGQSWRDEGTCSNCGSRGLVRYEKRFEVRIPPGVDSGARLRIAGEGNLAAGQAARGDLYIALAVGPHELFERRGKDLHSFFKLTGEELKNGGEVVVPTLLDGQKKLRVPPGTSDGAVFRLAGLGLRSLEDGERGDLFIVVGREPLKRAGGDARGTAAAAPPAAGRKGALRAFVVSHAKGLIITAGALLLLVGFIYLGGRRSGQGVSTTPRNANASPAATRTPLTRYSPTPAPTPAQPDRPPFSLPNGADIVPPQGPRGNMTMTVINGGQRDMALKIINASSQKTRRFVYVRAESRVVIRNLPREGCLLRWEGGSDWDVNGRRFLSGRSLQQFDKTFDLRRVRYTVDFTPSLTGTLQERALDESEFEDK
jgi:hypothetical protein